MNKKYKIRECYIKWSSCYVMWMNWMFVGKIFLDWVKKYIYKYVI